MSHHTAGIGVRERLALPAAEAPAILREAGARGDALVILATCNRFELYFWGEAGTDAWFRELAAARGVPAEALERRAGFGAVRHLFRVAAGLESQIVGETEILGQVRRAFDAARAAGATSRQLDAIFSTALTAGRRVRAETSLGRHPLSVSGAAMALADEWSGGLAGRHVVVLGAGEAAEGVLRALHGGGAGRVTLVARNPERAAALAVAWGVSDVRPWEALAGAVAEADVLVAATAATHPIVSAELVAAVLPARAGRPLLALDLCVPRNLAPELARLPGVTLVDLDGLQRRSCPAGADGGHPFIQAERIIADELARLDVQLRAMAAAPRLAELHRMTERLVDEEVAEALARLPALGAAEQAVVRAMAERLVRRVMYPVSRAMRHDVVPLDEERPASAGRG